MDLDAEMGPVVTRQALERIESYIAIGVEEGAELVVDGEHAEGRRIRDAHGPVTLDRRAAGTESGSLGECERRHARSDDVRYRGANFLEYLFQI
jgi:Aldehyde dehydrogenase family